MRCADVERCTMRYVDGRLTPSEARRVSAHLDVCPRCREAYAEEVELVAVFHGAREPRPDAELCAEVTRRVEKAAAAARPSSPAAQASWARGLLLAAAAFAGVLLLALREGTLAGLDLAELDPAEVVDGLGRWLDASGLGSLTRGAQWLAMAGGKALEASGQRIDGLVPMTPGCAWAATTFTAAACLLLVAAFRRTIDKEWQR